MNHTFATLAVSRTAHAEIKKKLLAVNYDHAIDGDTIDMHGIGLVLEEKDNIWRVPGISSIKTHWLRRSLMLLTLPFLMLLNTLIAFAGIGIFWVPYCAFYWWDAHKTLFGSVRQRWSEPKR